MILLVIIDKTGRQIRLTRKQWGHICEHPEMTGQIERISEALERPDTILPSPRDPEVHYYFRYRKEKAKYLLVAVKHEKSEAFWCAKSFINF